MSVTIYNTIQRPDGNPGRNVDVTVTLVWDTSAATVARNEDEDVVVRGTYTTTTDDDGYWEVALFPNSVIDPADSVYKITETLSGTTTTYYVSVEDAATPTVWIGDLLVGTPSWEA